MKTIVINGANSGIGLQATKILADDKNNTLILGCRNLEKAQIEISRVKETSGNVKLTVIPLNLTSFDSIHKFAKEVKDMTTTINVLACNAGLQIPKGTQVTKEGFDEILGSYEKASSLVTFWR